MIRDICCCGGLVNDGIAGFTLRRFAHTLQRYENTLFNRENALFVHETAEVPIGGGSGYLFIDDRCNLRTGWKRGSNRAVAGCSSFRQGVGVVHAGRVAFCDCNGGLDQAGQTHASGLIGLIHSPEYRFELRR